MSPFGSRKAWAWPPNKRNPWLWPPDLGAAAANPNQKPPLPASAVAAWHSEISCTSDAWVDYIGARSLPGVNSPVVAADPGFFKGRVVAQTSEAPIRNWANRALPTFATIGQRPWAYVVGRYRSLTTLSPLSTWGSTTLGNCGLYINAPGLAIFTQFNGNTGFSYAGPTADTLPHRFKTYLSGSQGVLTYDYADFVQASASANTLDWTAVGMATLASTGSAGYESAACLAYVLICSSKPTAAEEAALDAWAASYWGVPDRPPLPAATRSYFYGSNGMTPALATDQMPTGINLVGHGLAADLPIVGVDDNPAYFNGQPVGQTNRNNDTYWQQQSLVTLIAAGDRPWLYLVARMHDLTPGVQQRVAGIGNNFVGFGEISVAGSPLRWQVDGFGGIWNATGPIADATPHRIKSWTAGTTANLSVDDVLFTGGGAATFPTSVTSIGLGTGTVPNNTARANIGFYLICGSKPTAAEEAALDAWAKAFYGLP